MTNPGCGGMFYEKADNVRFNCESESTFYKLVGALLNFIMISRINFMAP